MPDEPARAMFEVDFWGAAHVSQEAVRFFREENSPQGGRLIQNSAGVGLVVMPVFGFYTAAKHGEYDPLFSSHERRGHLRLWCVGGGTYSARGFHRNSPRRVEPRMEHQGEHDAPEYDVVLSVHGMQR